MANSKSISGIYLFGQLAQGETRDPYCRYFPLPNICFARADDNTAVTISYDGEGKQTQTPAKASLLFSDALGKITAFTSPESGQLSQNLPLQGNPALATNFEAGNPRLLFFPPYLAPVHLLSKQGKDGKWLANLYNELISSANQSPKKNYFSMLKIENIQTDQIIPSDQVGDSNYAKAIGEVERSLTQKHLSSVRALVLPQQFTIVVQFSSAQFEGAIVTLSNFPEHLRINGSESKTNLTAASKVEKISFQDLDGQMKPTYSATFWVMSDSVFALKEASQYCRFDIDLSTLEDDTARRQWQQRKAQQYSFCERVLHLPIQTPLGRSALVNGDPVSVEEALFNQAPHLYPDLLAKLKQSPTDLPETLASEQSKPIAAQLWHSVQMNKAYIESAAQAMQHKLSWQTVAKIAAASMGTSADSELKNIAGATAASLAIMSKAYEIDNAAFGQKAIDLIKLFGDKGNILFDGLKDKINLVEVPPQWRALMQNMQVLENVGKGFSIADAVMKGGSLVEAYKKDAKASKKLDTVVVEYLATVQQPGQKALADFKEKKALSEVEKKALEQLKQTLPTLGDSDEVTVDTQVKQGQHLFELRSTTFAFDRSEFASTQAREKLVKLGEILSQLDQPIPITIKGHTCSRGSVDYNQDLSQRRADFVRECILEGIARNQAVWKNCIKSIGYGEQAPLAANDSEQERRRNRRVDMILHFEAILDYPLSRSAITVVEKARQMAIAEELKLDKATLDAIELALDTALDVASITPWGAAANFLYTVTKEGSSLISNLYDLCTENADTLKLRNNLEQIQYQNFVSQEQLLSFGSQSLSEQMKASYYKRAHALNGLSRLLLERNYQQMSGDEVSVEQQHIDGYIQQFLLNDQWQLDENGFGMVHLDEYYMDSDYAEAELSLLKASTYSAYAQLGASIVYDSVDDWLSNEQDDAPKPFMQYCPIHYRASSSIKALIDMFRVPFDTNELEALYQGAKQSISVKTLREGARQEWLSLHEHLQQYDSLSPLDEVRIIVVLDNKAIQAVPEEKRQLLHRVGIETQTKWSWLNHSELTDKVIEGSKIVSKSSEYLREITPLLKKMKLTSSERSIVTQGSGKEIWGAIIEPSYVFGANKIKGTRPWLVNDSFDAFYLKALFKDEGREIRSGELSLSYEYFAGIKGVKDSFKSISYDNWGPWDTSIFNLTMSPSRLYQFGDSKDPKHADHLLVSESFLFAPKPDSGMAQFPKVFDEPVVELHMLQRGLFGKHSDYKHYYKDDVEGFDWGKYVNCLAVVKTRHCDDKLFTNAGFAPGKVVGVDAKLREVDMANNVDFIPGVSGGERFSLGKTELYRIGTIVEKDDKWTFEAFTLQDGGKSSEPKLSSHLKSLCRYYSDMQPDQLRKHVITSYGFGKETDIYAQVLKPEYVNALGTKVHGLKPFKRVETLSDNLFTYLELKLELIGPMGSGLNAESDKLKVNLHSFDRNDIPETWYTCSDDVLRGAKEIIQVEEKDNYYTKRTIAQTYEQRYSDILPAIRWLEAKDEDSEKLSDEQLELINQWIESN
ncbi:OmpA family protein [Vibrio sp. Isolate24]|uniref:OmpA family protein n=1 Tax=Vibrio sp. Isolate24 TaxID=2908534 RepID=UPI001EFEA8E9|nr:OmpA family protein [Vibrio sp. Isolate24]